MKTEQIVKIIDFWRESVGPDNLLPRRLVEKIDLKSREIVDIAGPRRSGKSSLLKLLIGRMNLKDITLFMNFEDPFFIESNQAEIIDEIIAVFQEYYGRQLKYLFFDEIQNIENWEKAVRKLRDGSHFKIFLTGSSSKLLSRELSSLLTGRHISYGLMPLSFEEYLAFKQVKIFRRKDLILQRTKIARNFEKYLGLGGFPEIVLTENEELLKQYYSDILNKDIIGRYNVRQKNILNKMGVYLLSNSSKILSLAALEKIYDTSFEAISTYLEYFKEAFLIFELPQFSYSLKKQQKAQKKIYAVDTGLANAVSFRFSEDAGRILENCVFLHLNQLPAEVFYYRTKNNLEVDFLLKKKNRQLQLIQVASSLDDEKTKNREIRALTEAMEETGLTEGLILTRATGEIIKIDEKKTIKIVPAYEWLLTDYLECF